MAPEADGRIVFQNFVAFTVFSISQILLLEGTFTAYDKGGENHLIVYTALGIVLATLANLYLFKLINQLKRKADLEKRVTQLEQHQRMNFSISEISTRLTGTTEPFIMTSTTSFRSFRYCFAPVNTLRLPI
jgi:hypothetical protein